MRKTKKEPKEVALMLPADEAKYLGFTEDTAIALTSDRKWRKIPKDMLKYYYTQEEMKNAASST